MNPPYLLAWVAQWLTLREAYHDYPDDLINKFDEYAAQQEIDLRDRIREHEKVLSQVTKY